MGDVYETGQRLARLETAQEILTSLGASRSAWIYQEKKKLNPDSTKVQQWKLEREAFADLRDSLMMDDTATLEETISTYGPQLKALLST